MKLILVALSIILGVTLALLSGVVSNLLTPRLEKRWRLVLSLFVTLVAFVILMAVVPESYITRGLLALWESNWMMFAVFAVQLVALSFAALLLTSKLTISRALVIAALALSIVVAGSYSTERFLRPSVPSPTLLSLNYVTDEWNPAMVDLRTASDRGVPVSDDQALRLFNLWTSVDGDGPSGYSFQAEIYANDRLIGVTPSEPLRAGIHRWNEVRVVDYQDEDFPTSWNVQTAWHDLLVVLVTYRDGEPVDRNRTKIHLDSQGTAWLYDPPNVSFVSVVFSVNDSPPKVLDFRKAWDVGLGASPGDKLTILEIWYRSNATSDQKVHVEATLLAKGQTFDRPTYLPTQHSPIERGIHKLNTNPLTWSRIPENKASIDLVMYRDDGAAMDSLNMPLHP